LVRRTPRLAALSARVIRSTFLIDEKGKTARAQHNVKAAGATTLIQKTIEERS